MIIMPLLLSLLGVNSGWSLPPRGLVGRPPRGLGPHASPWATGGEVDEGGDTSGHYTKPQKTLQSARRLYKAPTYYTKPQQTIQSQKTIQRHKILHM